MINAINVYNWCNVVLIIEQHFSTTLFLILSR